MSVPALEHQSKSKKNLGEILIEKGRIEDHHLMHALSHQRALRKVLFSTVAAMIAASVSFAPIAEAGATGKMHISLTIIPSSNLENIEENEPGSVNIFSLDGVSLTQDSSGEYIASYDSSQDINDRDYSITTEFEHPQNGAKGIINFYVNAE